MLQKWQFDNLNRAAEAAVAVEDVTGVPAEVTVGQWAWESGWGAHAPGNNCFGIKGVFVSGQLLPTIEYFTEQEATAWLLQQPGRRIVQRLDDVPPDVRCKLRVMDWFAVYPTLEEAFRAHADLLMQGKRFKALWQKYEDRLPAAWAEWFNEIATIYATDPVYQHSVMLVIQMEAVQSALKTARG